MTAVRSLEGSQLQAWRDLQLMHFQLTAKLSRELSEQTGLSYPDYLVLAVVTNQAEGRMRAFELGHQLGWEKSRVSHHVARMTQRGLVKRQPCETDHRGAFVVVTSRGRKAIDAATPLHTQNLRRYFVDLVTETELRTLSAVAGRVLENLGHDAAGDSER